MKVSVKKLKLLGISCATSLLILSGCTGQEKEVTKESVIKETADAWKKIKSYEANAVYEEDYNLIALGYGKTAVNAKSDINAKVDVKNEQLLIESTTKQVAKEGSDKTTNKYDSEIYIDFENAEMSRIDNENERTEDVDYLVSDGGFAEALKAMDDDVKFKETDKAYVLSGEMKASYLNEMLEHLYVYYGSEGVNPEKDLKKVTFEFEVEIDKDSKLPKRISIDASEFQKESISNIFENLNADSEDVNIEIDIKTSTLEVDFVEYNKVKTDKIENPVSLANIGKKDSKESKEEKDTEKEEVKESEEDTKKEKEDKDSSDKKEEKEKSKSTDDASGAWDEYAFVAKGKTYNLPVKVSTFKEFGFVIDYEHDLNDMAAESYRASRLFNKETLEDAWITIYNPSKESKPVDECTVVKLRYEPNALQKANTIELPGGVKCGMSESELNKIYKEYTSMSYSKPIAMYHYGSEYGTYVKVHIRRDKDIIYKFSIGYEDIGN